MKILVSIILLAFNSLMVFGQGATVNIPNLTASPGTIVVPVNVTSFNNIAAISIYFEYDPAVVSFSTFNSTVSGLETNAYTVGSSHRIGITWSASGTTGSNFTGNLVNIVFNYVSGSSDFFFLQSLCEVADNNIAPIAVSYTNGNIGPINPALVNVPQLINQTPANNFTIPLNVNFQNITDGVNSFTFIMEYDGSKLVYQNKQNAALSGIDITPLTNPTRLAIEWLDASSAGSHLNGKLLDLVFNYIGGSSNLVFEKDNCHVADHNVVEVPAIYTNGLVSQNPASVVTVSTGIATALPGSEVLIPVTAANFTNVGAFDLFINYNKSLLSFVGLVNVNPKILPSLSKLLSNVTATGVGIAWDVISTALTIPSGEKLFEMKFNYSSGSTALVFDQVKSDISDFNVLPLTVNYVNGDISQASAYNATASIPKIAANPLSTADLPLNVTGFNDIEGFYMVVAYNGSAMNFTNLLNIPSVLTTKGTFDFNASGGKLYAIWTINPAETAGITIADNAKLFDMRFAFTGGSSDLVFDQTLCEVTKFNYVPVNVTYTDGSVNGGNKTLNLKLFLEGLYNTGTGQMNKAKDYVGNTVQDKYAGTIADQITVELRDATTYATLIYQVPNVELNQDGTATVSVPVQYQGTYYVTIRQRNHIETVSISAISFVAAIISYDFSTAATMAFGNNQKQLATGKYGFYLGDVNQDGYVNVTDRSSVNSSAIAISKGYIADDVNGDGTVNVTDRSLVNSAAINIIHRLIP